MTLWLVISIYLVILMAGLTMSFVVSRGRILIRVVTGILSIPLWFALALMAFFWEQEPPSPKKLERDFASKRNDLETILRMSDEDAQFGRIGPDFLYRFPEKPNEQKLDIKNESRAELSKARWDAYRKIYERNGIKLGIQRDAEHDAFIMMDSVGLLNRGHTTGYVHCAPPATAAADRFYPCSLNQEKGRQEYDPDKHLERYSFQRLDGSWYAYDDGPS
jgi:hypothetical protein